MALVKSVERGMLVHIPGKQDTHVVEEVVRKGGFDEVTVRKIKRQGIKYVYDPKGKTEVLCMDVKSNYSGELTGQRCNELDKCGVMKFPPPKAEKPKDDKPKTSKPKTGKKDDEKTETTEPATPPEDTEPVVD